MEEKIKLFLRYMQKEKELVINWDKEDGEDVEAEDYEPSLTCIDKVKAFISYRNIRIEEAWYSKLNSGNPSREVRERLIKYDAERSIRHSLALNSMIGFNRFGKQYGLPKFFDGELLEEKEIETYQRLDVRDAETDFFLQFIDKLNRTSFTQMNEYFKELGIKPDDKHINNFLRELQANVEKTDRDYGVKGSLLHNSDYVKFNDDNREFGN